MKREKVNVRRLIGGIALLLVGLRMLDRFVFLLGFPASDEVITNGIALLVEGLGATISAIIYLSTLKKKSTMKIDFGVLALIIISQITAGFIGSMSNVPYPIVRNLAGLAFVMAIIGMSFERPLKHKKEAKAQNKIKETDPQDDNTKRLRELKKMLNEELITKEDYETKKKDLIKKI